MFVVFEGIDGSGKTTVSNKVVDYLRGRALSVQHMRAGGKFASAVTEAIRELGRDARNLALVPRAEFLLYVAREVQLLEEALRPALASSEIVFADRFLFTPEVLARFGRHIDPEWTQPILHAAAQGIRPDLVVFVDVEPAIARARRKSANMIVVDPRPSSRKGLGGVGLQHRMRRGYLELAAARSDQWVVVDNEHALEDTVTAVAELVLDARRTSPREAIAKFRQHQAANPPPARPKPTNRAEALEAFLALADRRAEREPNVAAYLLGGLFGPGVDERRRALAEKVPDVVLGTMSGQTDTASWQLRAQLRKQYPRAVARTLNGIPNSDPKAAAMRLDLEADACAEVVSSLGYMDDPLSWEIRNRHTATEPNAVLASLRGVPSPQAWTLRREWISRAGDPARWSYEVAQLVCKSIIAIDDEEAWQLRKQARVAAPVPALASTSQLTSDRAWKWRRKVLPTASRIVMQTIRGLSHPTAWEMRRAVAADCKEAVDGMTWLDAAEAWELRETYADVWPSTVIKGLGPLAESARGRALIARQLERYPQSTSLLKHVAGYALGVHDETEGSD